MVQEWIRKQDEPPWTSFRPVQKIVMPRLLEALREETCGDFIVAAPTATGKTEAVFLPLATILTEQGTPQVSGASVLYVCPLTALIDQQAARLAGMFSAAEIPIVPWHGSSKRTAKTQFTKDPRGVLIITPESVESQLMSRFNTPGQLKKEYGALRCVVIDELHAFFDSPRGYQLISQLSRLELGLKRTIPRIGLSATFNEKVQGSAKRFLRPENAERVEFLRDTETQRKISFCVRCFAEEPNAERNDDQEIVRQVIKDFSTTGKKDGKRQKGLVFVNSRQQSEFFSHHLEEEAKREKKKLQFHPHHGSLSPQQKDAAIEAINSPGDAAVLVCTTTLELGLDIGSIAQVGQIDPGATVASLQQRLGRSGRKHGDVARLIVYVREAQMGKETSTLEGLHLPTFQALAQIHLVREEAFEEPEQRPAHLSTLIQQILSFTRQNGSITEEQARQVFIERGPFVALRRENDPDGHLELLFARLEMAGLLEKRHLGNQHYYLAANGLSLMEGHHFYAAFQTYSEFSVYGPDGLLGKIPLGNSYKVGDRIIFSRQLWLITSITRQNRVIRVVPAAAGQAPIFPGDPITPSQEVITTMRGLYEGRLAPGDEVSDSARDFFQEGQRIFQERDLARQRLLAEGDGVLVFPWFDDRGQMSLMSALRYWGLSAMPAKICIFVRGASLEKVKGALARLADPKPGQRAIPSGPEAARNADSLLIDKHDHLLSPYLQRWNFASFRLDMERVPEMARSILSSAA